MTDDQLKSLIARNPNHPKYGVPCPLILICNVTGKETKYTAPEYIKSKLDAAGSLEALLVSYKCKGAGKTTTPNTQSNSGERSDQVPTGVRTSLLPKVDGAPKQAVIPKSKQSWRGKTVVMGEIDKEAIAPAEIIHREYKFKDGMSCHVYFPRQNSEQLPRLVVALN